MGGRHEPWTLTGLRIPAESVAAATDGGADMEGASEASKLYAEWRRVGTSGDEQADIAFYAYESDTQREIIEALILGGCGDPEISEVFSVPTRSLAIYRELFFDTSFFRTGLDKIAYVEEYADQFGRGLKKRALNLGYEYVLYTYGNIMPKTDAQKNLLRRLFMTSAYKAMNMNYESMTSATMKQAVEHGKLMLKASEALNAMDVPDAGAGDAFIQVVASFGGTVTEEPLIGELI